jgi:hypothetical protein
MADKKISALTAATTPLAGTEVLPIVQGGSTVKASVDNVLGPLQSVKGLTAGYVLKGNNTSNVSTSVIYDNGSAAAVGTTTPQGAFSIGSPASGQIGFTLDWTGGGGPYAVASFTADRGTGEIRHFAYTNYYHVFYANNAIAFKINTTGNAQVVGAGKGITVTSPDGLTTKTITINNAGAITLV